MYISMVCQKSVRCHCEVIASIGFYSLSAPGYALVKHFNLGVYKEAPVHSGVYTTRCKLAERLPSTLVSVCYISFAVGEFLLICTK